FAQYPVRPIRVGKPKRPGIPMAKRDPAAVLKKIRPLHWREPLHGVHDVRERLPRESVGRLRGDRKAERDAGAAVGSILGPDAPAVSFDESLGDCETEAGSAAAAGAVGAEEAFEDARRGCGIDAGAGVLDVDVDLEWAFLDANGDRSVSGGVAERVRDEVREHAFDLFGGDADGCPGGHLGGEVDVAAGGFGAEGPQGWGDDLCEVGAFELECQGAGVDLCEFEEVVDELRQRRSLVP